MKNSDISCPEQSAGGALLRGGLLIAGAPPARDRRARRRDNRELGRERGLPDSGVLCAALDFTGRRLALLERSGRVMFRSHAWRNAAEAGNGFPFSCTEGENFFNEADTGETPGESSLRNFRAGIRSMFEGARERLDAEFVAVASAGTTRFHVAAELLSQDGPAVVSVEEIPAPPPVRPRLRDLMTVVRESSEAVLVVDAAGRVECASRGFEALTGYTFMELRGGNCRGLVPESIAGAALEEMRAALKEDHFWRGLLPVRKKNGESCRQQSVVAPILAGDGTAAHYVAVQEAAVSEAELREALLAEKTCIERADLLMERLMARMSRESRELDGIAGYEGLMHLERTQEWPAERCRCLGLLRASSERLEGTVERILRYAIHETGAERRARRSVNIARLLSSLIASLNDPSPAKDIRFTFRNEAGAACVLAEERALRDAFRDLLYDAVARIAMEGEITVTLRREGASIAIRIKDTGDAAHRRGRGLVPALARRCIEANGGRVAASDSARAQDECLIILPEIQPDEEGMNAPIQLMETT